MTEAGATENGMGGREEAVTIVAPIPMAQRSRRVFQNQGGKKLHNPRRLLLQDSDEDEDSLPASAHSRSVSASTPMTPSFTEIMATLDDQPVSIEMQYDHKVTDGEVALSSSPAGPLRRHSRVSSKRLSSREFPRLPSNMTDPIGLDTRRLSSASTLSTRRSIMPPPDSPMMSSAFNSSFTSLVETEGMSQERVEALRILRRRQAILRELVTTELSFAEDLSLIVNEYENKTSECPALSEQDARQIFGGVEPVLLFSTDFAVELQSAVSSVLLSEAVSYEALVLEDASTTVGVAFGQFMNSLSKVFANYCSTHERAASSLQKVAEVPAVNQWLAERHPADRTTAWDLPSLLIKPVQRVLKYPLLLSALLQASPKSHPDYYTIELALKEMLMTAENINNIKKRRDLMGNIAAERKKTNFDLQAGIAKTFSRRTTKVKQAAGLEVELEMNDGVYDGLAKSFQDQEALIQNLQSEVSEWLLGIKSSLEYQATLSLALNNVADLQDLPPASFVPKVAWKDYTSAIADLQQVSFIELTHNLEREVFQPLSQLEATFSNPKVIMAERDRTLDDFNTARMNILQGENPDKSVSEGSDRYSQLNDTLIQELPKFLRIARKAMNKVTLGLASVQKTLYQSWYERLQTLAKSEIESEDICGQFRERSVLVYDYMENFTLLRGLPKPPRHTAVSLRSSEESSSTCDTSVKSEATNKALSRVAASNQRRHSLRERAQSAATSAQFSLKAMGSTISPSTKSPRTSSYSLKLESG